MMDRIQERGVKGLARYAVLVFPLLALVCGLGSSLWSPSAVSAQEPEVWLVRGDGYQVLEGLDLVSINAGRGHSCGLRADGLLGCWGSNTHGQTDAPSGRFSQVSAGEDHNCGLRADGSVVCWGSNTHGQTDAPSGRFSQVSTGAGYSCGVRADGAVVCWGAHLFSNLQVSGKRVTVSQAGQHIEKVNGRIVARRVADGRTEFGFQPEGEDRVLPRSRFFPANAGINRWLQSRPVSVDGQEVGRINARLLPDGRIEFGLLPVDGQRILPQSRFFPANARADRWLRSSVVMLE